VELVADDEQARAFACRYILKKLAH
jgi:hypothetical protein